MNTEQLTLQESIAVNVTPRYLPEQSNEAVAEYTFAYTVEIANLGDVAVQLLARHWIITDGNNSIREIEGEGVVGEQPHIKPGEIYQYSSGAILSTKTGTMEGSYKMCSDSGLPFDAIIKPFGLVHPNSLQ
ncbi:Co2+/Mg2+ efflux protein ApaG [Pseudomonadales bacterium]|nr:Co2+/Mg2+ efflux protein ApaG [Pseudomonadales bacterium]MDB2409829.1 Co2+/Mg2+ efflux protein ApaG [Pseudomonadales bacterium]MDG1938597.1 Co2+/Mg2+ efflux protein ApaG [Pseudomonadales bacterium]